MKKITYFALCSTLLLTSVISFLSFSTNQSSSNVEAVANPAAGATYYATNQDDFYYQGIDESLTGEDLIVALSTLTSTGFVNQSYSSLPNIYQYSDLSMSQNNKMVMVYTGTEVSFSAGSMPSNANKEHVWPASWYGNGSRTESAGSPGADAHNVWPSATDLNSKRGSCAFDELDFTSSYKCYEFGRTDWSYGSAGDNDSYVWSTAFNYSNGQANDAMYPARGHRGAIARILMYVATRYRNNTTYPVMLHDQAVTLNTGRIGKLSTLLKWHFIEPPTEWEIRRNNEVATRWHHNRNPFVDHPEFASRIYYHLPEPGASTPTAAVKNVIDTYGELEQGITLDKSSISLFKGDLSKINVVNNPNSESINWSSSNDSVASVDQSGNISALEIGTTTITAQGSTSSATCLITVRSSSSEPILVSSLSITPSTQSMKVGDSLSITPTIAPSDATNKSLQWTSSNTAVAVVNDSGEVVGLNVGTATISAFSIDGSNKSATCTITVTERSSSSQVGWNLVEQTSDLSSGDRLVIASNSKGFTAASISSSVMGNVASTFSSDKKQITTLGSGSIELTLGGTTGAWTLSNSTNQLLGATSVKNLAWNSGTTTWTIAIDSGDATISSTNSSFGRFLYNVSSPRFTTYTSVTSSSMLLPQLYVYVESLENSPQDEAYDYVSSFMDATASECAASNVSLATWNTLKDAYSLLSADAKDYIYDNSYDDDFIATMIARYAVIVNKYGYDNFMTNSSNVLVLGVVTNNPTIDPSNTLIGLVILAVLATSITLTIYVYVKSKRPHRYK